MNLDAGDTATGIMRWWIPKARHWTTLDIVEAALDQLISRGVVGTRVLATGERYYFGRVASED